MGAIFLVHNEEKDSPANKRDESTNDDEPLNPGKNYKLFFIAQD